MSTVPDVPTVPSADNRSNALAAAFVVLVLAALVVFGYTLMKAQADSEVAAMTGSDTGP